MLVKPIGVKTQNIKFWPLRPISHDASQMLFFSSSCFNQRKFFMHQTVVKQCNDIVNAVRKDKDVIIKQRRKGW